MFEILHKDVVIGSAEIIKEGLYYRFICSCVPPDDKMYRIHVSDGLNERDLGICVPKSDRFTLTARVPVKFFANEELSFYLSLARLEERAILVEANEPFEELDQLETARFQIENGQPGIIIDPVPDQPDSDRNQEYEHKFP